MGWPDAASWREPRCGKPSCCARSRSVRSWPAPAETGATSAKQMGVVMKAAQARLTGKRVDGKALSDLVRARLQ